MREVPATAPPGPEPVTLKCHCLPVEKGKATVAAELAAGAGVAEALGAVAAVPLQPASTTAVARARTKRVFMQGSPCERGDGPQEDDRHLIQAGVRLRIVN